MRRFVISVALVAAVGCGDREVAQLDSVKKAVCACDTVACADEAMKAIPQADIRASARARQVARDMMDCLARLNDAKRPKTDPDAAAAE